MGPLSACLLFLAGIVVYLARSVVEAFGEKYGLEYITVRTRIMNERAKLAQKKNNKMQEMGIRKCKVVLVDQLQEESHGREDV